MNSHDSSDVNTKLQSKASFGLAPTRNGTTNVRRCFLAILLSNRYADVCGSLESICHFEPDFTIQPGDSPVRILAALAAHTQTVRSFMS